MCTYMYIYIYRHIYIYICRYIHNTGQERMNLHKCLCYGQKRREGEAETLKAATRFSTGEVAAQSPGLAVPYRRLRSSVDLFPPCACLPSRLVPGLASMRSRWFGLARAAALRSLSLSPFDPSGFGLAQPCVSSAVLAPLLISPCYLIVHTTRVVAHAHLPLSLLPVDPLSPLTTYMYIYTFMYVGMDMRTVL